MALRVVSQAHIARLTGVTRKTINDIVAGRNKNPRLRKALSQAVKIPMNVWKEMDRELKAQKEARP